MSLVETLTIQVTEACRLLKPLPHFQDKDNCEDEASSDSDDENSGAVSNPDDTNGQIEFFTETFETSMPLSSHTVSSYHCDQLMSELNVRQRKFEVDRIDCIYPGTVGQKNCSSMNPAAAIDIMESEIPHQTYPQQANNNFSNFFQSNDSPSMNGCKSPTWSKEKSIDELMMHMASITPKILVRDSLHIRFFISFFYRIEDFI